MKKRIKLFGVMIDIYINKDDIKSVDTVINAIEREYDNITNYAYHFRIGYTGYPTQITYGNPRNISKIEFQQLAK